MSEVKPIVKHLLTEEQKNNLNHNPLFQAAIAVLGLVIGVYLTRKGWIGWKEGRVSDKRGRIYTGTKGKVLSAVYMVLGVCIALSFPIVIFSRW